MYIVLKSNHSKASLLPFSFTKIRPVFKTGKEF